MNHLPYTSLLSDKKVLSVVIAFFILTACSNPFRPENIKEGRITYDVSFPYDQDNPFINIYPKEMSFVFKDGKIRAKLSSFAEVVRSEFIIDNDKKEFTHCFKVFDEKYVMELSEAELGQMMDEFPATDVLGTAQLDSLAGFLCRKSIASFAGRVDESIDIYHTNHIIIPDPNWYNQFHSVPEVLLSYEIEQFGKRMKLVAREISCEEIPDSEFELPKGYTSVSFGEMKGKISELVAQFNQ